MLGPYLDRPELTNFAGFVIDQETGNTLWENQGSAPMTPASVTKVVTAAAVLAERGPDYRIPTTVVVGEQPGEVVLVAGGDVTLSVKDKSYYPGAASLTELAAKVKAAHPAPITKLVVDSTLFVGSRSGPEWDNDVVSSGYTAPIAPVALDGGRAAPTSEKRVAKPDLEVGRALSRLLNDAGTEVELRASENSAVGGPNLSDLTTLGAVSSPPVERLVEFMLINSDNTLAEALARQVAVARKQPASFEGAAQATLESLRGHGVEPGSVQLYDGSGLSRRNRLTVELLARVTYRAGRTEGRAWRAVLTGLPVAGFSGTLHDRFVGDAARPGVSNVRAKTGSLSGVSSLVGTMSTADGARLSFAFIANGFPDGGVGAAKEQLDAAAATVASCGCH